MSNYIPKDNLFIILKYLPVKTLLRFRSVCKDWKQFIDSPTLAQLHLSVQKPQFIFDISPIKYLVVDPRPNPLVHKLSKPIETENYLHLVGTLHGVVCLYHADNLVLWNPSLRKISTRRFPSFFRSLTSYGFWIDPSTKEFKAIMLQQPVLKCIMYSSSSIRDGWSEIPTGKINGNWNRSKEGPPVIVGGAAHWGGYLHESINDRHRYLLPHPHQPVNSILSFDFEQESFDIIEIPYLHNSWGYSAPCRWKGTLSFVREGGFPCGFEIYSRQEDSRVKMVGFKVDDHYPYIVRHVYWAMEDVEARKKKRNRKKDVELERLCDLSIGETQENVKLVATTTSDGVRGELILHGTKTGRKALMKGLMDFEYGDIVMAYDFVESLLFP